MANIKECNRLQDTYSNRRKSRRKVFCAIELGVGNFGLSQGAEEEKRGGKRTKVNGRGREALNGI